MFNSKLHSKRLIVIGGTLFCAWSIGFLMQRTAHDTANESSLIAPQIKIEPLVHNVETPLKISDITLTSAISIPVAPHHAPGFFADTPVVHASVANDAPVGDMPSEEHAPTFVCEHHLTASPSAAAMVTLTLDAPCMVNDRFTIHHNGMMFTGYTDDSGKRSFSVPALSSDAVFIAAFSNGEGAVAKTTVTSLESYDRVVVQWSGDIGLHIHAREFGASYGEPGHVWAGHKRDVSSATLGQGGFITRLGSEELSNARLAEVYTFPSGGSDRGGDVALSLETEVTQSNCGRDIEAQSIQLISAGTLNVRDVVLAVPDCDAVGDFLVLKNILNDLKIASN